MPVFLMIRDFGVRDDLVRVSFRDFNTTNIENFRSKCGELEWGNFSGDPNSDANHFVMSVNDLYRESFPLRVKDLSHKRLMKPWLSSDLLKLIKTKALYYKKLRLNLIGENVYKKFKNRLVNSIRRLKRSYYFNAFKNYKTDIKKTWKIVSDLVGTKKNVHAKISLVVDGEETDDCMVIAEHFNNYFCEVATHLECNIPPPTLDPVQNIIGNYPNSIYLANVTNSEILDIVKKLNNSSYGLNSISTRMFKVVADVLVDPLCTIINTSFQSGIFPDCLKHAVVTPIFKSGTSTDSSNYRPISILPLLNKIIEKCMLSRLSKFMDKFGIINSCQFGFLKGKSTSDGILNFVEYVYGKLNTREHTIGVGVDLSKEFDTVNHDILIRKLFRYGVRGVVSSWFRSYLAGRTQSVRVGDAISSKRSTTSGVPQGSVLGPSLFILYINDVVNISVDPHFTLYADDTTIALSNSNLNDLVQDLNSNLNLFHTWTINNRISLNANKTSALFISNRSNVGNVPPITINNVVIPYCDCIKFLGVFLDSRLNFSRQLQYVCSKVSKAAGIFFRINKLIPLNVLIKLYYSLVYPFILYGVLVWGGAADTHLNPLFLIQKRIIRTITSSDFLSPSQPLFYKCKILKLKDVYKLLIGIHMYNRNVENDIEYPSHDYDTRFRINAVPSFQRLSQSQRSLTFSGPTNWNSIPEEIRNSASINTFKKNYKNFLLNSYFD